MALRKKVLFLQLPQIDNDLHGDTENIPLAAAYLQYAAEQEGASPTHEFIHLPESATAYDNPNLLSVMVNLKPDIIVCTLYLWNIERTVRMMQEFRTLQPTVRILFGGPEAAMSHPFLFKRPIADAIVVGEGETVFPALLRSFKTRQPVNFSTVAIRTPKGYRWGTRLPAPVRLSHQIPPPGYEACRPDAKGMAYLETSRGCPRHCTYCRYPHLRRSMSFLEPDDILSQIAALLKLGAREIRFVDPTFNAHPRFRDILLRLAAFNRKGSLSFFAELNAERVTDEEADLLAKARFVDIEVGVQSRDATVLKAIRRPTSLIRLDAGIKRLTRRRIRTTVDIMYGLPTQRLKDVRQSLNWALKLRHANIQCLQTLLLPGTELRELRAEWRIQSQALPPYAVTKTSTLSPGDFQSVEHMIAQHPTLRSDVPTPRFVGRKLDLFAEQITASSPPRPCVAGEHDWPKMQAFGSHRPFLPHEAAGDLGPIPGTQNRRAFLFTGADLFARRKAIASFIGRAIRELPDNLFQFVLVPEAEEPLDLLDELIAIIRRHPSHLIDRYASVALKNKIASRRLMIQLPRGRSISREWTDDADSILSAAFF